MSAEATTPSHAEKAPSDAYRWLNCLGSIELRKSLGVLDGNAGNDASEEGTAAHELAALSVGEGKHPSAWLGRTLNFAYVADQRMVDAVAVYYDAVMPYYSVAGYRGLERKLPIAETGEAGTCDHWSYAPASQLLLVDDYKNGRVGHHAREHPQTKLYALGVLHWIGTLKSQDPKAATFDIRRVRTRIIQPNRTDGEPAITSWDYTPDRLRAWGDYVVRPAVERINAGGAPLTVGTWCKNCPAAGRCVALAMHATKTAKQDWAGVLKGATVHAGPVAFLGPTEVNALMQAVPVFKAFVDALQAEAKRLMAHNPNCLPAFKIVESKSARKWVDQATVMAHLQRVGVAPADFMDFTLAALTKVEPKIPAKIRAEVMKALTTKPNGYPVMVPATDPRPRIGADAKLDFAAFLTPPTTPEDI